MNLLVAEKMVGSISEFGVRFGIGKILNDRVRVCVHVDSIWGTGGLVGKKPSCGVRVSTGFVRFLDCLRNADL